MHIKTKLIAIILTLSVLSPAVVSAKGRGNNSASTSQLQSTQLTAEEENLLWMREEEKLARDVYLTMYDLWGASIFNNIAKSEQSHMDALLKKIELYGLTDPVAPDSYGVGDFNNKEFQQLYITLTGIGQDSYRDALWVGANIEDLDIHDLMEAIKETKETNNLALQTTYESLLEGSKSHLRAFVSLLGEYTPEYIDPTLYKAIINAR
ncbi:MAG: DUF2202 domain-containing protein [Methyloprofundus sp.]|nr:DUF2202 domain-containing protein [Methyloprofundus sp.]